MLRGTITLFCAALLAAAAESTSLVRRHDSGSGSGLELVDPAVGSTLGSTLGSALGSATVKQSDVDRNHTLSLTAVVLSGVAVLILASLAVGMLLQRRHSASGTTRDALL